MRGPLCFKSSLRFLGTFRVQEQGQKTRMEGFRSTRIDDEPAHRNVLTYLLAYNLGHGEPHFVGGEGRESPHFATGVCVRDGFCIVFSGTHSAPF